MRYREHRDYPEMKARLTAAFKAIRQGKIVARQNFSCCGGCACAELGDFIKDRPKYRGAVYFHRQDNDALKSHGEVYLGFGARPDAGDDAVVAIGNEAVACLRANGLEVEWDGTPIQRILVRLPQKAAS